MLFFFNFIPHSYCFKLCKHAHAHSMTQYSIKALTLAVLVVISCYQGCSTLTFVLFCAPAAFFCYLFNLFLTRLIPLRCTICFTRETWPRQEQYNNIVTIYNSCNNLYNIETFLKQTNKTLTNRRAHFTLFKIRQEHQ